MTFEEAVDKITKKVAKHFASFGGDSVNPNNPVSVAMKDKPPMFAAGVDIREVVTFILLGAGDDPE